jgi:hypothetical protein
MPDTKTEPKKVENLLPGADGKKGKGLFSSPIFKKYKWPILGLIGVLVVGLFFLSKRSSSSTAASANPDSAATTQPAQSAAGGDDSGGGGDGGGGDSGGGTTVTGAAGATGATGATGAAGAAGKTGKTGKTGVAGLTKKAITSLVKKDVKADTKKKPVKPHSAPEKNGANSHDTHPAAHKNVVVHKAPATTHASTPKKPALKAAVHRNGHAGG